MKSTPTVSPLYSTHNNASEGGGRKVHLSIDEGPALCGRTDDFFNLGLPYVDIEKQFFLDPDGNGCRACGRIYRRRTAPKQSRMAIGAVLLLLVLPVLSLAQQSAQNDSATLRLVAACNRGVYDECELVAGHWYYRVGAVWTRDDGVVGKPPVVPVVPCPVQQSFKEASRYDLSFLKDARTYIGVGFSFVATGYDISTSHGYESTRFYRGSDGQLNRGKYLGITALTNVALLPLDLQRDHRWRWASLGLRVGLAGWRMKVALRNGGQQ